MLVGVAFLPPSFPPSRTQAFYIIERENCVYFCNRVYVVFLVGSIGHYFLQRPLLKSNLCPHNLCSGEDILIDLTKVFRAMTLTINYLNDLKCSMEQGCYLSSVVVPLLICLRWLFGNLFLPRHYNKAFINFYLLETVKRTMLEGGQF